MVTGRCQKDTKIYLKSMKCCTSRSSYHMQRSRWFHLEVNKLSLALWPAPNRKFASTLAKVPTMERFVVWYDEGNSCCVKEWSRLGEVPILLCREQVGAKRRKESLDMSIWCRPRSVSYFRKCGTTMTIVGLLCRASRCADNKLALLNAKA